MGPQPHMGEDKLGGVWILLALVKLRVTGSQGWL